MFFTLEQNNSGGEDVPTICGEPIDELSVQPFRKRCFTHYKDGRIVETKFIEK